MDIRQALHPDHFSRLSTQEIRSHFLIESIFVPGSLNLTYSHYDRVIIGGACPDRQELRLPPGEQMGVAGFLDRREMGVINIGAPGTVRVGDKKYHLENRDCLYLGRGAADVSFASDDPFLPARFYLASASAHQSLPTVKLTLSDAKRLELGDPQKANVRTIYQFIHPAVLPTCQLVMGMTLLAPGSVWNTMPTHTHERRMEVYLYFQLPQDGLVFHLMGKPEETRHIVVRNEEAVISPSWSIHSGVGTGNYSFIWAMAGENQTFTDMDDVSHERLK